MKKKESKKEVQGIGIPPALAALLKGATKDSPTTEAFKKEVQSVREQLVKVLKKADGKNNLDVTRTISDIAFSVMRERANPTGTPNDSGVIVMVIGIGRKGDYPSTTRANTISGLVGEEACRLLNVASK